VGYKYDALAQGKVNSKLSKQFIFTLTLLRIPQTCSNAVDYFEIRTFVLGLDVGMETEYLGRNLKLLSTIIVSILIITIIITKVIKIMTFYVVRIWE
jgi:hypothetical protein